MTLDSEDLPSNDETVAAYLLVSVSEDGEAEPLVDVETVYSAEGDSVLVRGEIRHFSFIIRRKGLLEIQLFQIEPRQRRVGENVDLFAAIYYRHPPSEPALFPRERTFALDEGNVIATGSIETSEHSFGSDALNWLEGMLQSPMAFRTGMGVAGSPAIRCVREGMGVYTVQAKGRVGPEDDSTRVALSVDAFVGCVASEPLPTDTPGPSPTPTPISTPTPIPSPTPVPEIGIILNPPARSVRLAGTSTGLSVSGLSPGESFTRTLCDPNGACQSVDVIAGDDGNFTGTTGPLELHGTWSVKVTDILTGATKEKSFEVAPIQP